MSVLASDFLVARLREWNIRRIPGSTDDRINGIIGSLERADGEMFNNVAPETSASGGC